MSTTTPNTLGWPLADWISTALDQLEFDINNEDVLQGRLLDGASGNKIGYTVVSLFPEMFFAYASESAFRCNSVTYVMRPEAAFDLTCSLLCYTAGIGSASKLRSGCLTDSEWDAIIYAIAVLYDREASIHVTTSINSASIEAEFSRQADRGIAPICVIADVAIDGFLPRDLLEWQRVQARLNEIMEKTSGHVLLLYASQEHKNGLLVAHH